MFCTEEVEGVTVAEIYVVVLIGNLNKYIGVCHHTFLTRYQILRTVVGVGTVPDGALQDKDGVGREMEKPVGSSPAKTTEVRLEHPSKP